MSNIKISADKLASTINGILQEFAKATYVDIKKATDKTARQSVENIKDDISFFELYRTRKYRDNWASKTTKNTADRYKRTIYNRKKPGLAHLLQNGHGGPRPAPAHPHIQQDDETARIFEENLRKEMNS